MLCLARFLRSHRGSRLLPAVLNRRKQSSSPRPTKPSQDSSPTDLNEPIKFFGSEAAAWSAKSTRSGGADETLWYQPYVISGSLAIFMLYFCILREENDIDQKLEGNLYNHVTGLEELQLTVVYRYNKENGLDTSDLEKRLTELGVDIKQLA